MNLQILKTDEINAGENIRKDITKESLSGLIESIRDKGILQPLLVKKVGEKFELIAGFRRFNAAKYAKLETVPALLFDIDNGDNTIRD